MGLRKGELKSLCRDVNYDFEQPSPGPNIHDECFEASFRLREV